MTSGREGAPRGRESREVDPAMVAVRRSLPATRRSVTHKFSISNHEGYLTIGLDDEGAPGEIFIKMAKEGSMMSGMCQAFCRAFSIAIQYGLSLEDAVSRFRGMRFEPWGATSNPDIPEASSIVDYVARYLEQEFLHGDAGANRAARPH
jgi:ribonucleoside-diphosphate reductase alpha chain